MNSIDIREIDFTEKIDLLILGSTFNLTIEQTKEFIYKHKR